MFHQGTLYFHLDSKVRVTLFTALYLADIAIETKFTLSTHYSLRCIWIFRLRLTVRGHEKGVPPMPSNASSLITGFPGFTHPSIVSK